MTDEDCGYADEGEDVFCLAFVAAVQASAAGKPRPAWIPWIEQADPPPRLPSWNVSPLRTAMGLPSGLLPEGPLGQQIVGREQGPLPVGGLYVFGPDRSTRRAGAGQALRIW